MRRIVFLILIFVFVLGGCQIVHTYSNYRIRNLCSDDFVGIWVSLKNSSSLVSLRSDSQASWVNFPMGKTNGNVSGSGEWAFDNFENLDPKISLKREDNSWTIVPIFWSLFDRAPMLMVWHNIESGDVEYFEKQVK